MSTLANACRKIFRLAKRPVCPSATRQAAASQRANGAKLASSRQRMGQLGFTLVELMVVITIIGILSGMVLYALAGAKRDAQIIRTQGTIKKISDVILLKWEEYRYRSVRVNVPPTLMKPYQTPEGWQVQLSPREGARARMLVLRDTMRMEMPDRFSDLLYPPIQYRVGAYTADNYVSAPNSPVTGNDVCYSLEREVPGLFQAYRRTMVSEGGVPAAQSLRNNPYPAGNSVVPVGALLSTISTSNQSAELLYEIVANSTYQGGSALEYFGSSEIGDTDNDGLKEFLDAWGRPIYWLRWPSGFVSPLNDTSVPDPMDPIKTDWRWSGAGGKPWMLVPLIVSAGPDGVFDIVFDFDPGASNPVPVVDPAPPMGQVRYALNSWTGNTDPGGVNIQQTLGPYYFPDPYVTISGLQLGATYDLDGDGVDGSLDNISNYELVVQ